MDLYYLMWSLLYTLPSFAVGIVGLALAGRYGRSGRVLAVSGSAVLLLYGLFWLVLDSVLVGVVGYSPEQLVWDVANFVSLAMLLAALVLLAVAGLRRDAPGSAAWHAAPPHGAPPGAPFAPQRPPYQDGV